MLKFQNNYFVPLVLVCFAVFLINLDALYVNIMEARNFITAREMLHDGHWLLTTINGEPRFQKPPLPTWLTAFSAAIFGLKVTAMRLPAAIMAIVLILVFYRFSVRFTHLRKYAFISSIILATSFYIVASGRDGQWDIFTHSFMMVCIYYLYRLFTKENKKYINAGLAAVFFGFAFMSKGPVSFYALLLPFLIAFASVYKVNNLKSKIFPGVVFLILAVLISGWWYGYTYLMKPNIITEIAQKESTNWTNYNVRPFYYYWSFFTQSGVWTIPAFIGLLYPYLKSRVADKKAYLFTFLWTLISVILLSIIPEKKSRYLLPVLIPLALNTGFYIEYLFREFSGLKNKWETIPVYFNFGLIACIGIVFPIGGYIFLKNGLAGNWIWFILLSIALFAIGILILKNLYQKKIQPVFYLTVAFILAILVFGLPMAKIVTLNPEYKSFSALKEWQNKTQIQVYELTDFTPELVWDYGDKIKIISKNGQLSIPDATEFGVLVTEENQTFFKTTFKDYSIKKITRYDMNPQSPEHKSHKTRLARDLYLVKKR